MTPIEVLQKALDALPSWHPERPGMIRAIELLRHGGFFADFGPARIDVTLWPRTGGVSVHEHRETDGSDDPKVWHG